MYGIPNMKLEKWVIDRKDQCDERRGCYLYDQCQMSVRNYKAAKIIGGL